MMNGVAPGHVFLTAPFVSHRSEVAPPPRSSELHAGVPRSVPTISTSQRRLEAYSTASMSTQPSSSGLARLALGALAVATPAAAARRAARRQQLQLSRGSRAARRFAEESRAVQLESQGATGSASLEDEIAALQREAAALREGAIELEREKVEQMMLERQRWFQIFDPDGSGSIDLAGVRRGMKEFNGTELDETKAMELLQAHDANQNGVLEFEEFDPHAFQATLERMWAEERAREEAERQRKSEEEAIKQAQLELEEYYSTLPGNPDTSWPTRFAAVLAYALPLLDGLRFGLPLAAAEPSLAPFLYGLVPALKLLNATPFGQLLVFITMQVLAANQELPALLRFNLRQAIALDIALVIPNIIVGSGMFPLDIELPTNEMIIFSAVVFLPLLAAILYSALCNLSGTAPRSIPFFSQNAERSMGMWAPRDDRKGK